jgi:hypothetical protein
MTQGSVNDLSSHRNPFPRSNYAIFSQDASAHYTTSMLRSRYLYNSLTAVRNLPSNGLFIKAEEVSRGLFEGSGIDLFAVLLADVLVKFYIGEAHLRNHAIDGVPYRQGGFLHPSRHSCSSAHVSLDPSRMDRKDI